MNADLHVELEDCVIHDVVGDWVLGNLADMGFGWTVVEILGFVDGAAVGTELDS